MKRIIEWIGNVLLVVLAVVSVIIIFLVIYDILGYFNIGADGS